jgi:hypothetical protein
MKNTAKQRPILLTSAMILFSVLQTAWAMSPDANSEPHAASPKIHEATPRIPVMTSMTRVASPTHSVAKSGRQAASPRIPVITSMTRVAFPKYFVTSK